MSPSPSVLVREPQPLPRNLVRVRPVEDPKTQENQTEVVQDEREDPAGYGRTRHPVASPPSPHLGQHLRRHRDLVLVRGVHRGGRPRNLLRKTRERVSQIGKHVVRRLAKMGAVATHLVVVDVLRPLVLVGRRGGRVLLVLRLRVDSPLPLPLNKGLASGKALKRQGGGKVLPPNVLRRDEERPR